MKLVLLVMSKAEKNNYFCRFEIIYLIIFEFLTYSAKKSLFQNNLRQKLKKKIFVQFFGKNRKTYHP